MSQQNQTRSEERKTVGCESTSLSAPLPSRQSIKPWHPQYDALTLAFIKSKVAIDPNGCWLWQGFVAPNVVRNGKVFQRGYGFTAYRGENWAVHRLVWHLVKGPIPDGMHVCHTCDVRRCVNPDHLWIGTNRENITDMVKKGRGPCGEKATATHCKRGHAYAEHGDSYGPKHPHWRRCKLCDQINHRTESHRAWRRQYQRKRRAEKRAKRLAEQRA